MHLILRTQRVFQFSENLFSLTLESDENLKLPIHIPGQYISIYPEGDTNTLGRCYSITSVPSEKSYEICFRVVGKFSEFLSKRLTGDKLISSAPFGYFYPEEKDRDLVLVAGGVGITPFLGMIREMKIKGFVRTVKLFYSNKSAETTLALSELRAIALSEPRFELFCSFTAPDYHGLDSKGRLEFSSYAKLIQSFLESEFYICGSMSFTRDMFRNLTSVGVSPKQIFTEAFYSS